MKKILVIEDDLNISNLVKINLEYSGFIVDIANDGEEGLRLINPKYDIVILDLMLPKIQGFDLLPHITKLKIPVIILSAKDTLSDKVNGLNIGADDYLVKPFESVELIARIKSVLRRSENVESNIRFGDLEISLITETVKRKNIKLNLTYTEYKLLSILCLNSEITLSRDRLLEQVWGYENQCDTRTVDMHINRLRTKIGADLIKTVMKKGYKFSYEVI